MGNESLSEATHVKLNQVTVSRFLSSSHFDVDHGAKHLVFITYL